MLFHGLGLELLMYDFINKKLNSKTSAVLATIISLLIPTIMAAENWDDHIRTADLQPLKSQKTI